MANGDLPPKKISKIRTFQNDISSVRPSKTAAPAVRVLQSVTEKTPQPKPLPKQSLFEQTIFRTPAPTPAATAAPELVKDKTVERMSTPLLTIPKKITSDTPPKETAKASLLEQTPLITTKSPSSQMIPKETLASIASDDISEVISDDTSAEGSIITDQKRTRFSLMSSIAEAMQTWFADEKESFKDRAETRRKAIPTVRPVEKRKEIVQKAAQQSAIAPRDDHLQLATKFALPKTKIKEDVAPVQISKKTAPKKPSWSHFTDNQAKPAPKEEAVPTVSVPEKIYQQPNTTLVPPTPVKENSAAAVQTPSPAAEVVETKTLSQTSIPSIVRNPVVDTTDVKPRPSAVKFVGNKNKVSFKGVGKFFTYFGIAIVIVIAITSGAGLVWWLFANSNQSPTISLTEETPEPVEQELVSYEETINVLLPAQKGELWQSILNVEARAGSDLVLVSLINDDNTPATAAEVLAVIKWSANPAFLRNIEKINFGQYRGVPFMVIRTINFDTAFGGLLSAEATMQKDLNIFTGDNSMVATNDFTDELIQNHDVRVLKQESGSDVLVYGFINRNTIVITGDNGTFSEVANRVH